MPFGDIMEAAAGALNPAYAQRQNQQLQDIFKLSQLEPEQQLEIIPHAVRLGHIPESVAQPLLGKAIVTTTQNAASRAKIDELVKKGDPDSLAEASRHADEMALRSAKLKGENIAPILQHQAQQAQQHQLLKNQALTDKITGVANRLQGIAQTVKDPKLYKQSVTAVLEESYNALHPQGHPDENTGEQHSQLMKTIAGMPPEQLQQYVIGLQEQLRSGQITAQDFVRGLVEPNQITQNLAHIDQALQTGAQVQHQNTKASLGIDMPAPTGPAGSPADALRKDRLDTQNDIQKFETELRIARGLPGNDKKIGQLETDIRSAKTALREIDAKLLGSTGKFSHFDIDPNTGKKVGWNPQTNRWEETPMPSEQGGMPGAGAPSAQLTGEEFLKSQPVGRANLIKSLSEGKVPWPGGAFALSKPAGQALAYAVSQYDPTFDAANYPLRFKTEQEFKSGKYSLSKTAANTVMGHIDRLDKSLQGMKTSDWYAWNLMQQSDVATKLLPGGAATKAKLNRVNADKQAVTEELERLYRGTGGSTKDIEQWKESINAADSPQAMKAAINEVIRLVESRMEALASTYNQGTGKNVASDYFLTDKAKESYARLTGKEYEAAGTSAPAAAPKKQLPTMPAGLSESQKRLWMDTVFGKEKNND